MCTNNYCQDNILNFFNDPTKQVNFLSTINPYNVLGDILGSAYFEYRKKWAFASAGKLDLPYPLQLDISLNDACNIKCHFCPQILPDEQKNYPLTNGETLTLSKFAEIVEEGVNYGLASLSFGPISEPLLIPNIAEYINVSTSLGVLDKILYTNGHLLTEKSSDSLINSGLTWINISLGATTKKTYESMRDHANFDKVVNNILNFIKIKKARKKILPLLRLSFVNTKQNTHELTEFISFWKDKVDVLSIQNLVNLHQGTANAKNFLKNFFIGNSTQKKCYQPWTRLLLRNNGNISPCCRFFGLNIILGNIYKESIYPIYNSDLMKNFKRSMLSNKFNTHCERCLKALACEE